MVSELIVMQGGGHWVCAIELPQAVAGEFTDLHGEHLGPCGLAQEYTLVNEKLVVVLVIAAPLAMAKSSNCGSCSLACVPRAMCMVQTPTPFDVPLLWLYWTRPGWHRALELPCDRQLRMPVAIRARGDASCYQRAACS